MIEIVVCDDNEDDLNYEMKIVRDIFHRQKIDCKIKGFSSAEEMLHSIKKIDIGILDIAMGNQNGIDLGRELRQKFSDVRLIYITSFEQYAIQAINDVHAYSYLCKPLDSKKMYTQLMELFSDFLKKDVEKIFYNVMDSNNKEHAAVSLKLDDILYFEYVKRQRRVIIVLENETYVYECIFEKIVDELKEYDFIVNCRGNLVNLKHVVKIKGYTVYLDNDKTLPISQRRMTEFKKDLNNFLQRNL